MYECNRKYLYQTVKKDLGGFCQRFHISEDRHSYICTTGLGVRLSEAHSEDQELRIVSVQRPSAHTSRPLRGSSITESSITRTQLKKSKVTVK